VSLYFFRRTIHIDINILNLGKGSIDVDQNGRIYIFHVPFDIYVMLIQRDHIVMNNIAHGGTKLILFNPIKIWEKIISMVKIHPRPIGTNVTITIPFIGSVDQTNQNRNGTDKKPEKDRIKNPITKKYTKYSNFEKKIHIHVNPNHYGVKFFIYI
jgi:hypothetical protein